MGWTAAVALWCSLGSSALEGPSHVPLLTGALINPLQTPNPLAHHAAAQGNSKGHADRPGLARPKPGSGSPGRSWCPDEPESCLMQALPRVPELAASAASAP